MMHGQNHHAGVRALLHDFFAGGDAIKLGHRDVHQNEMRAVVDRKFDCLTTITGFSNHGEPVVGEGAFERFTHHSVVIGEEQRNWHREPSELMHRC